MDIFSFFKNKKEPFRYQKLEWRFSEWKIHLERMSLLEMASVIDQKLSARKHTMFTHKDGCFENQERMSFDLFVKHNYIFVLLDRSSEIVDSISDNYTFIADGCVDCNQQSAIFSDDMTLPDCILHHAGDLIIFTHDADSMFVVQAESKR